jgi:hypothetical protein
MNKLQIINKKEKNKYINIQQNFTYAQTTDKFARKNKAQNTDQQALQSY